MSATPENPPAFACANSEHHQPGMTLRDWFAGQATEEDMEGFIAKSAGEVAKMFGKELEQLTSRDFGMAKVEAKFAYADAMLAYRAKGAK